MDSLFSLLDEYLIDDIFKRVHRQYMNELMPELTRRKVKMSDYFTIEGTLTTYDIKPKVMYLCDKVFFKSDTRLIFTTPKEVHEVTGYRNQYTNIGPYQRWIPDGTGGIVSGVLGSWYATRSYHLLLRHSAMDFPREHLSLNRINETINLMDKALGIDTYQ